jgi:signal peptidase I
MRVLAYVGAGLAAVIWGVVIVGVLLTVVARATGTVNMFTIPNSAMEPTLHCARPAIACESGRNDRVAVLTRFAGPDRGDIVVFDTTPRAVEKCVPGGKYVKRVVGLPGETLQLRLIRGREYVYVDGSELDEPYVQPDRRPFGLEQTWKIPEGRYFLMGDNRSSSCDSRIFGAVPASAIVGEVVLTYWPPNRISFR